MSVTRCMIKLKTITLQNFKGIENLTISLNEKTTILFGINGVGKTTIVPVRASKEQFIKLDAFDKAMEDTIDFRNLFEWFRNQEDIENQAKVREDAEYEDRSLTAVKRVMLEDFNDIHIDRKSLVMKVEKDGDYLTINQLSDGEKCTTALFGDLARRMALANPARRN